MNTNDQNLGHRIKLKFGTAPNEPTQYQLDLIKKEIQSLFNQGVQLSERDWAEIVKRHCPSAGSYGYAGEDNSDLITLLQLATNQR